MTWIGSRTRFAPAGIFALSLAATPGCGLDPEPGPDCERCDSNPGFEGAIDGLADPIAEWLRNQALDASGVMEADFHAVIDGIREIQGCSPEQDRTFAIADDLVSDTPFPRLVATVCAGTNKATDFFLALSFEEEDDAGQRTGNVDVREIEMFAWDPDAETYRFYATAPVEGSDSAVQIEVDPPRCAECHLTPSDIEPLEMGMLPIMNELTQPWTHWNAQPGFPSHGFDPDPRALEGNYGELAVACTHDDGSEGPCAASELEQLIRKAHDRVALTRVRSIFNADPDVDQVMSLLRPMFCTEQVNYVTEDFESGIVLYSTLVDRGLRNMLRQVRPDNWPQAWMNDRTMRLPAPTGGEEPLAQIPVRGNADIRYENQLVTLQGLKPHQVMQIRALDYARPVFSEFRCGLWQDALARMKSEPPDLSGAALTRDAITTVLDEILRLGDQPITTGDEGTVVALERASDDAVVALEGALRAGEVGQASCEESGYCAADPDELAALVQAQADAVLGAADPREEVRAIRDRRICFVRAEVETEPSRFPTEKRLRYENLPSLPEVSCP